MDKTLFHVNWKPCFFWYMVLIELSSLKDTKIYETHEWLLLLIIELCFPNTPYTCQMTTW